ncbi:hypothetical protein L2747_00345 [Shewanella marinintestina]|nr:hypothetical protein [Shewanella marinintestina]MCL1144468.1 hypothetical protein [Shewanella marinintestina]
MVAKEIDVHVSEMTGLKPLDFVERDDVTGKVSKGESRSLATFCDLFDIS